MPVMISNHVYNFASEFGPTATGGQKIFRHMIWTARMIGYFLVRSSHVMANFSASIGNVEIDLREGNKDEEVD